MKHSTLCSSLVCGFALLAACAADPGPADAYAGSSGTPRADAATATPQDASASSSSSSSSGSTGSMPAVEGGAVDTSFVGTHGALQVVGNEIHDRNGMPIQLRGMSLYCWNDSGLPLYSADVVKTLAEDWQSTLVRAAVPIDNGYLRDPDAEMVRLDTVVNAAIANDMYVLIDWHDHHADRNIEQAQTFFGAVAQKYKNVPNVIFEIWNEPVGDEVSWAQVKAYSERTLGTIRGAGATNLVVVGTPNWSTDAEVAADDRLDDPNVAYTLHFYAATHKATTRDEAQAALDKGVALFATEWGTCQASGNGFVDVESTETWLAFLAEHHISWANWSLSDADESCAALVPDAPIVGPWTDAMLTASGQLVKSKIGPRTP